MDRKTALCPDGQSEASTLPIAFQRPRIGPVGQAPRLRPNNLWLSHATLQGNRSGEARLDSHFTPENEHRFARPEALGSNGDAPTRQYPIALLDALPPSSSPDTLCPFSKPACCRSRKDSESEIFLSRSFINFFVSSQHASLPLYAACCYTEMLNSPALNRRQRPIHIESALISCVHSSIPEGFESRRTYFISACPHRTLDYYLIRQVPIFLNRSLILHLLTGGAT